MTFRALSRPAVLFTALLTGASVAPSTLTFAQQLRTAPVAPSPALSSNGSVETPATAAVRAAEAPAQANSRTVEPAQPRVSFRDVVARSADRPVPTASTEVDAELECLAKVVLHEAGNQSRAGQRAVAHVVMNRVRSGRFRPTICGTVMQRGQFFNVHAYNGQRDPRWRTAVAVAREVRDEEVASNVGGALFFRASYGRPFPGRTRVVQIGDHTFYR